MKSLPTLIAGILIIAAISMIWQGIAAHLKAAQEQVKFQNLQLAYYSQSKAVRDAAPTDSQLNRELAVIENYPSELARLNAVGIGKMLVGISLLLLAIAVLLVAGPIRIETFLRAR